MESREKAGLKDKPKLWEKLRPYVKYLRGPGVFCLAFVLSGGQLMGYIRPFGLCFAMSRDEDTDRLWACAGAFCGGLMIFGSDGMAYAAACIIALAVDIFWIDRRDGREIYLPFLLAAVIVVIKAPFALYHGPGRLALLTLEGIITAAASACLALPEESRTGRWARWLMLITAFSGFKILGVLSPSNIAGIVMTMAAAYTAPSAGFAGAAFGLMTGGLLDMASSSGPFFASAFGIAAVISASMPGRGRISFGLIYLISGIGCVIWGFDDPRAMGCVYDLFTAASLFLLLPDRLLVREENDSEIRPEAPAPQYVNRLRDIGRAIGALSRSAAGEADEGEEDIAVIFDRAASAVCRDCPNSGRCWIEGYGDTINWLCDCLPVIRDTGHIEPSGLPGPFADICLGKSRLCAAVNHEYMSYLRRRAARCEEREKRRDIRRQYDGLEAAIAGLSEAASSDYVPRPALSRQVKNILKAYGRRASAEAYTCRGRLNIRVGPVDAEEDWVDEEAFLRSVRLALGVEFCPAETISGKGGDILLYREKETLTALVSCSVRKKEGEEVCGDSSIYFKTDDGRAIVMISDGMGAGERAGRLSKNALELMASFIKSGCPCAESAGAVLPFLKVRYGFEGFATLDALEIDLFTGACRLIKCGAADSYLVSRAGVDVLSSPSLPPGAGEGEVRPIDFFVRSGDRIVMVSDGGEVPKALLTLPDLPAGEIVRQAADPTDDFTAVVITVTAAEAAEDECPDGRSRLKGE